MTEYARVSNNTVVEGPKELPKTWKDESGNFITGFSALSDEKLKTYGWYPVVRANLLTYQQYVSIPTLTSNAVYYGAEAMSDDDIVALNKSKAKGIRDTIVESNITVLGYEWEVDDTSRTNMKETIDTCEWEEYEANSSQTWILADNSTITVTAAMLKEVLIKYTLRKQKIWAAYITWKAGDMLTAFSYTE